jgi:hypothetical protein
MNNNYSEQTDLAVFKRTAKPTLHSDFINSLKQFPIANQTARQTYAA